MLALVLKHKKVAMYLTYYDLDKFSQVLSSYTIDYEFNFNPEIIY